MGPSGSEPGFWGEAPDRSAPSGDVTHVERRELDALRRRAYGPDADIFDDEDALARLHAMEERVRADRFAPAAQAPPAFASAAAAASAPVTPAATVTPVTTPRAPRWHGALVAATAAVAVLLGGTAWSAARPPVVDAAAGSGEAAEASEQREEFDRAGYRRYVDGLRDDVLALAGSEEVADRMIRDQLRPYGILYGRTVGVGPTVDHRFCMIIADLPRSSVTCIPVENAYANPVSVLLPAWYADADSDLFTGLGELVAYTLLPGGSVLAEPADSADAVVFPDAAAPAPIAIPPPGWQ
ncbi:MAG TPA: hypothetical protein VEX42_03735 [Microbacterium sp.]|nr:hypothetical protein [Microbacterium sp.]